MRTGKELTALPSKIILLKEETVLLDSLSAPIKAEIHQQICANISRRLSLYYQTGPGAS